VAHNILYAQSGGPTPVINATACGVIQAAEKQPEIDTVYAGANGIFGVLNEELIDTSLESSDNIEALKHTPGAAFGSCRFKLDDPEKNLEQYKRLFDIFAAHDIRSFLYNGGGDSHDTAHKISIAAQKLNVQINCLGLPKTIDNDLAVTDNSPGFGSVAKYIATATQETARDLISMSATSTKVFILEVMGRHAGWIAASSALGKTSESTAPHIVLLPEVTFDAEKFTAEVQNCVSKYGHCFIVASEGIRGKDGRYFSEQNTKDAFGHGQLGGVAPKLAHLVQEKLGFKYHWGVSDYLQRAASHLASATDMEQAYAIGVKAVELAAAGETDKGLIIKRLSDTPYRWEIGTTHIGDLANFEIKIPNDYIQEDGFGVTETCLQYMRPLIQGEACPRYKDGLPVFADLKAKRVEKKLPVLEKQT
jgi:ATP-dependent phosphofructokinase / diphosphate-dependent phosphofructokinase